MSRFKSFQGLALQQMCSSECQESEQKAICHPRLLSGALRARMGDLQTHQSVLRRFSHGNGFLTVSSTHSKARLDSAGGNQQLASGPPGKHILAASGNRCPGPVSFLLFRLSLLTPEEKSAVTSQVEQCSSQNGNERGLFVSQYKLVCLPLQTNLTDLLYLLPKEWSLS